MTTGARVLHGLDEFMLRLGHVTLVCEIAASHSGSSGALQRNVARRFTQPVKLEPEENRKLANYFIKKKLCARSDDITNVKNGRSLRYRDIQSNVNISGAAFLSIPNAPNKLPEVWLQDYLLAQPEVVSRVGAVTIEGKSESKTGISHILDWCQLLNVLTQSDRLTPIGQIIVGMRTPTGEQAPFNNPYILGPERLPLAYAYISADYEIFIRLVARLAKADGKLTRSHAMTFYAESVVDAAETIGRDRNATTKAKREVYDLLKDLQSAAKSSRKPIDQTSTCWHRASSRFETMVDLGFLGKGGGTETEKYEYIYSATPRIMRANASIQKSAMADQWLDEHLVDCLADPIARVDVSVTKAQVENVLPEAVRVLRRPTAPLPVNGIVLAVATRLFADHAAFSLETVRKQLMNLFAQNADLARISGGSRGPNEQFVSINLKAIGAHHVI